MSGLVGENCPFATIPSLLQNFVPKTTGDHHDLVFEVAGLAKKLDRIAQKQDESIKGVNWFDNRIL